VVIIVQEKPYFDNYFGTFPGANGQPSAAHGPAISVRPTVIIPRVVGGATHGGEEKYSEKTSRYFSFARQFPLVTTLSRKWPAVRTPTIDVIAALRDHRQCEQSRTYQPPGNPSTIPTLPKALEECETDWPRTATRVF